jgi:Zn-dependent protease
MNGLPVARILGFEVRVHLSWVLILALVTAVAAERFALVGVGLPASIRWIAGGLVALALLGSVLAHELGHALVARRVGLADRPITLFFFGGAGAIETDGRNPWEEVRIAAAGPAASLAIAAVLLLGAGVVAALGGAAVALPSIVGEVLLVLGVVNLLLAVLNLLPAFPLDGGRLLRAIAWSVTDDVKRAGRLTSLTGRTIGWGLVALGIAVAVTRDPLDGAMIGVAGWFLANAGRAMERRLIVEELIADVHVEDAMERDLPTVVPQLTLDTFAERYLGSGEPPAIPVVAERGWLGIIGVSQLRRLARRAWPTTRAEDLMVSPPALPLLAPDDDLWGALENLRRSGLDGLPVVKGGDLLGVLTRRAAMATIEERARTRNEGGR